MQAALRRHAKSPCIFCLVRFASPLSTYSRRSKQSNDGFIPRQNHRAAKFDLNTDEGYRLWRSRRKDDSENVDSSAVDLFASRQELNDIRHGRVAGKDGGGGEKRAGRSRSLVNKGESKKAVNEKIRSRLAAKLESIGQDTILSRLKLDEDDLRSRFSDFADKLKKRLDGNHKDDALVMKLHEAMERKNLKRMELEVKMAFFAQTIMAGFSIQDLQQQEKVANLQYPQEWFPATRAGSREFHLHVGPTNSGKTYQALKRLEQAEKGLYAGPLRLLAHEVYMRLNARGQRCNLVTGDERKTADDNPEAPMSSCTVEMVPLNVKLDVAVIDEIQVIGSEDRGWAWTQAVLGVQAKEVHLCGEERAVPIIKEIAALCGEKLHIHRYERLSPLKTMNRSLAGNIQNLQKGDCVVCFSVMAIHGLRQLIEKTLKVKVAVIYGSLPPETRAQQARLFNDPDNDYDILVASDAVGMGLNLSIKRMIFQSAHKFHSGGLNPLHVHEVKQIAGRAGRYSTAENDMKKSSPESASARTEAEPSTLLEPSVTEAPPPEVQPSVTAAPPKQLGLVTTLEKFDLPAITKAMSSDPKPITSAGIFPPSYIVERFVRYFQHGTPFSFLLNRLHEIASTNSRFHLCDLSQQIVVADAIEEVEDLTTTERMIFCSSPIDARKPEQAELLHAYAELVAGRQGKCILDVPELNLDILDDNWRATRSYLSEVETLHKGVVLWMWLSYRFPSIFIERELAVHVKEMVEKRIADTLEKLSFDFQKYQKTREQMILDMLQQEGAKKEPQETSGGEGHLASERGDRQQIESEEQSSMKTGARTTDSPGASHGDGNDADGTSEGLPVGGKRQIIPGHAAVDDLDGEALDKNPSLLPSSQGVERARA